MTTYSRDNINYAGILANIAPNIDRSMSRRAEYAQNIAKEFGNLAQLGR